MPNSVIHALIYQAKAIISMYSAAIPTVRMTLFYAGNDPRDLIYSTN